MRERGKGEGSASHELIETFNPSPQSSPLARERWKTPNNQLGEFQTGFLHRERLRFNFV
jgi:hypothetical protein